MAYGDNNNGCVDNVTPAIHAGMAIAEPHVLVEGHALAFTLPQGAKVEQVDIEKYLDRPTRKRGSYVFDDARSFIAFVNREKTAETVILATRGDNPLFTAVFNGNEAERTGDSTGDYGGTEEAHVVAARPGWGDHKASFSCPFSEEWKRWTAQDGERMTQAQFATFIEDNALDIIQPPMGGGVNLPDTSFPDSATMINVSSRLEAKNDVVFASALKLSNGEVQFKYEEQISGSVSNGTIEVPQRFAVGIPVFQGTDPWVIIAKLRYRIERGGLVMWFDFERLFKVKERAFDEARAQIATGTAVPIFLGRKA